MTNYPSSTKVRYDLLEHSLSVESIIGDRALFSWSSLGDVVATISSIRVSAEIRSSKVLEMK